ncbi:MAG: hypothetical protein BWK76_09210 [Desulfobulbaceae bacterium A2]|nr:MAG: hypothetical protein BWK76_09210 [Desulfobulbaceae bacterium A2]
MSQACTDTIAVSVTVAARREEAHALAAALGLSLVDFAAALPPLRLCLSPTGLELRVLDDPCLGGAVRSDFSPSAIRAGGSPRHPLLHAVGRLGRETPLILDLTAGLGRDAFRLAAAGCRVTLLERHPVVAALLADGIARAAAEPLTAPVAARMTLLPIDARDLPRDGSPGCPPAEIVLLDPMFPTRNKSARVKKELQVLQRLLGDEGDGDELLALALQHARRRVVVKRPRLAPYLAGHKPSFSLSGRTTRYDIYLITA